MQAKPDFSFEKIIWEKGIPMVAGIDEVGRGSLAGPVVAACTVVRGKDSLTDILKLKIDDSKRMNKVSRARLVPFIEQYFYTGIGTVGVSEINAAGIVKATQAAMKKAINVMVENNFPGVATKPFFLVDGYQVRGLTGGKNMQKPIIHGDRLSVSIAAASVIAKVYRDKLMDELSEKFPVYSWGTNKGYGTLMHRTALKNFGICQHHRTLFVDSLL